MAQADDGTERGAAAGAEGATPLPPGLELLWGRRERGRRGRSAELTLDAIVSAAIAVADAEGLSAVSMARVAKELGYSTMALYRHVRTKDELLQVMWNASAEGAPVIAGDGWRERLRSWALGQWGMLQQRTWVLEMPMSTPPAGPNSLAWVEQAVQAMDGTGLDDADRFRCIGLLSSYTLGEARMAYEQVRAAGDGPPVDYAAVLREVADAATYPAIHRAAWSGRIDDRPDVDIAAAAEEGFLFGLERILDGIAVLIDGPSAPQPPAGPMVDDRGWGPVRG